MVNTEETKQNPAVRVSETTKSQLDKMKLVECETYDSVITRLFERYRVK